MDGLFDGGMGFRVEARILRHDGRGSVENNRLLIRDAREIILQVNVGTDACGEAPAHECATHFVPTGAEWESLKAEHAAAYRDCLGDLELHVDHLPDPDSPTNQRLARLLAGEDDPGLVLQAFHYGRYLHVAATATAQLPPNLQGGWNDDITPPWDCDYHTNINMQLNYWLAEPAGLYCGTEQLFRFIERYIPHARKCARDLYGCRGVCFPIQADPWGRATPESYGWAAWTGAAAWLAQHMWWHYEYSLDKDFLRTRAYPFFKEIMDFYEDYLIDGPDGKLHLVPSQSPENRFVGSGKLAVSLCVDAAMDIQFVESALAYAIQASEILGCEEARRATWQGMMKRLPEYQIGGEGQLQEWNEDREEVDINHRHFSHLFGVYPADLFGPERRPELFAAAKKSLERRLSDKTRGHIGWRDSWAALLYARFLDRENAWWWLCRLIDLHAETAHMNEPHHAPLFQIEGFQGSVAAVCEMLLQSQHEELHLLPCLPDAWPSGQVRGIRARGGYSLDISWEDGHLREAVIRPSASRRCRLIHAGGYRVSDKETGMELPVERKGREVIFDVAAGKAYAVQPAGKGQANVPIAYD